MASPTTKVKFGTAEGGNAAAACSTIPAELSSPIVFPSEAIFARSEVIKPGPHPGRYLSRGNK